MVDGSRDALLTTLRHTGALTYARRRAEDSAAQARAALDVLPPNECRDLLASLTDWTVRREK